jgi:hypothetical protein
MWRGWVDAEFLADVRELGRVGQARVGHHDPQRRKTCVGEEQPRRRCCMDQQLSPERLLDDFSNIPSA